MGNQVAPFGGKPLAPTALQSRLQRFKKTAPRTSDGSIFMKMGKDGEWSFGSEEEIPEEDSRWAINPNSIQQGYICWPRDEDSRGGGPLDEVMYDAGADIPLKSEMKHIEAGEWTDQLSVGMRCMNGEDEGVEVVYKTNSKSGVRELNSLIDEILKQMEEGKAETIPVVLLRNDWYKHKKYGKIYTPVLDIVEWLSFSGEHVEEPAEEEQAEEAPWDEDDDNVIEGEAEEVEPEPEEKPKRTRRTKAKADPVEAAAEEQAEDEAPVRRRRRRS